MGSAWRCLQNAGHPGDLMVKVSYQQKPTTADDALGR
jgi:hypothetical protein